jgi:hypothetical protein
VCVCVCACEGGGGGKGEKEKESLETYITKWEGMAAAVVHACIGR